MEKLYNLERLRQNKIIALWLSFILLMHGISPSILIWANNGNGQDYYVDEFSDIQVDNDFNFNFNNNDDLVIGTEPPQDEEINTEQEQNETQPNDTTEDGLEDDLDLNLEQEFLDDELLDLDDVSDNTSDNLQEDLNADILEDLKQEDDLLNNYDSSSHNDAYSEYLPAYEMMNSPLLNNYNSGIAMINSPDVGIGTDYLPLSDFYIELKFEGEDETLTSEEDGIQNYVKYRSSSTEVIDILIDAEADITIKLKEFDGEKLEKSYQGLVFSENVKSVTFNDVYMERKYDSSISSITLNDSNTKLNLNNTTIKVWSYGTIATAIVNYKASNTNG
ncbi:MAG: hypothetical protein R3Y29_08755, partial [bacterium]